MTIPITKRTRADDVFRVICLYALENQGSTPNMRKIADQLGLSQQRVCYLMMRLEQQGRIQWLDRYTYKVPESAWEPPPDAEI